MSDRVTGHVSLRERKRGPVYYLRYRLADGRQVQKLLGPAWTERSRPPAGYFTKRTAEEALQQVLADARRGMLPDSRRRSGTRSAMHAPSGCATSSTTSSGRRRRSGTTATSSTARCCRSSARTLPIEKITTERIEEFRERLLDEGRLTRRSVQKTLVLLYGILKRAKRRKWITSNPAEDVERVTVKRSGDFNVLSPVEVGAVARAAESPQDAAMFTVAAFTGLRLGELRALRWRDVDFAKQMVLVRASFTHGAEGRRSQARSARCR